MFKSYQWKPEAIFETDSESHYSTTAPPQRARDLLIHHPPFHGRVESFEFEWTDGVLIVKGAVPTYYLKQLLQSALKKLEGVRRIENCVVVVRPERDDR